MSVASIFHLILQQKENLHVSYLFKRFKKIIVKKTNWPLKTYTLIDRQWSNLIVVHLLETVSYQRKKDAGRNQTFKGKWKTFQCELKACDKSNYCCTSEVINAYCVFQTYNMLSF